MLDAVRKGIAGSRMNARRWWSQEMVWCSKEGAGDSSSPYLSGMDLSNNNASADKEICIICFSDSVYKFLLGSNLSLIPNTG